MMLNKIVARFKDGKLMKGTTSDFFPNKKIFHVNLISGEIVSIVKEELKALFFVRDFEGNKTHKEIYTDIVPGGGRKVMVEFNDGEIIVGFSQGCSPNLNGFFLIPADIKSNNERIYIVTSATKKMTFLDRYK
jgi:hypothetical protein